MSLFETFEHSQLRKKIRQFAENEIKPVINRYDEQEEFPIEIVKKMGKEGLLGINIPQKYGGKNKDFLSYIIAVEELARVDSSCAATIAAHNSLGISPIFTYGSEKQKQKFLPGLCTGQHVWALGITEKNAGSDIKGIETKAELINNHWVINGSKLFITNSASKISAGISIGAITGMQDNKKEISVILVESNKKGYHKKKITGKLPWRAIDNGDLTFKDVQVPEENLLGERGKGVHIILSTLDGGRLSIAAIGLGLAQGAYEMALEYSKNRQQFGKNIAEFQAISFKLADMATKIELARNTLYHTCKLKEQGKPFAKEAAMIKLYCSEIAREIADEAIQVYGAAGLLRKNSLERFYRDQRLLQIGEGTSEILRIVISRNILA